MFDSIRLTTATLLPLIKLRERGCDALIAGGAVRDTMCKRPIRDIDIFIQHFGFDSSKTPIAWVGLAPGDDVENFLVKVYNEDFPHSQEDTLCPAGKQGYSGAVPSPHIHSVFDAVLGDIKYQFIFVKMHPLDYIKRYFDFGLCRAWCDGTKMTFSESFLNDQNNKTLTLDGDLTKKEFNYAMHNHGPRILQKYNDHSICVASHLLEKYGSA